MHAQLAFASEKTSSDFSRIFWPKSMFIVSGVLFIWAVASLHSTVWGFRISLLITTFVILIMLRSFDA